MRKSRGLELKRVIDVVGALLALIVFSPLLAGCALLVYIFMGRPVIFRQTRPGYRAVPFTLYKLRTMRRAFNPRGEPLPDGRRLTGLGRLLRRTSLDELPELYNVLRGELSLVGPRPLLLEYLERYTPEQKRRHEMPPGITGWAQVHGRNLISWDEKFRYDVWYVDHWSLGLDFRILARTVWKVLNGEGISQEDHPTADEFRGEER